MSLFVDDFTIKNIIEKAINEDIFPGAAIGIYLRKQKKSFSAVYGHRSLFPSPEKLEKKTIFDLASLTKPLATTLALLCLLQEKKIALTETLPSLLERDVPEDKKEITLFHLLNHCSGLADYRPFYRELVHVDQINRKRVLLESILQQDLAYPVASRALYSDLGFILLGEIIEIKSGRYLSEYVREKVMTPIGLAEKIIFNPLQKSKKNFAATEDCLWRKKVLSGEVHDDNCWTMGGVCGHAGLFADMESVLFLTSFLLDVWLDGVCHPNFSTTVVKNFFKRQNVVPESSWALGFDTPSEKGSSAGKYISRHSVGHLGFTGTSFWIDPERELVIVLLTNRVHPSRENTRIRQFRPLFHDTVIECMEVTL